MVFGPPYIISYDTLSKIILWRVIKLTKESESEKGEA